MIEPVRPLPSGVLAPEGIRLFREAVAASPSAQRRVHCEWTVDERLDWYRTALRQAWRVFLDDRGAIFVAPSRGEVPVPVAFRRLRASTAPDGTLTVRHGAVFRTLHALWTPAGRVRHWYVPSVLTLRTDRVYILTPDSLACDTRWPTGPEVDEHIICNVTLKA